MTTSTPALCVLCFLLLTAFAQAAADPGVPDTAALVMTVQPDSVQNRLRVQIDLFVFNDSTIIGATAGFSWDNPQLRLDSARPSPLAIASFDGGTYFFRDGNIDSTNFYRQFIFGGYRKDSAGVPPAAQRQLWATYYFTLSGWTLSDSIVIDSFTVPPDNGLMFVVRDTTVVPAQQRAFVPSWTGRLVIKDASDVHHADGPEVPDRFSLSANYPNPFNPITQISFAIPIRSYAILVVYNVMGQTVKTIVDQRLAPGRYVARWDGTDEAGTSVATGIYFYRLEAGGFTETKKMVLVK
ncbi:MAG TPA: T9SS type A sorting domain-containing protein [Candidatus Deferrimicrobium sp.]|nr:T9SS type A sorting domain-containing protein [Candidatus Deferrimicrobium sp.]